MLNQLALKGRIVITGASGLVGTYLLNALVHPRFNEKGKSDAQLTSLDDFLIYGCFRSQELTVSGESIAPRQLDLLDGDSTSKFLDEIDPDTIVHLANINPVDVPSGELVYDNEIIAGNLVGWCKKAVLRRKAAPYLLFTSTDVVYDGSKTSSLYSEVDQTRPLNPYGKSKLLAESVIAGYEHHAIVRVALVYGFEPMDKWTSRIVNCEAAKEQVYCFEDEFRSIIFGEDLAQILTMLCRLKQEGLFVVGGAECMSRYEYARRILKRYKLNDSNLIKGSLKEKGITNRAPNIGLDSSKILALMDGNRLTPFHRHMIVKDSA